jgi:hypothetical protein
VPHLSSFRVRLKGLIPKDRLLDKPDSHTLALLAPGSRATRNRGYDRQTRHTEPNPSRILQISLHSRIPKQLLCSPPASGSLPYHAFYESQEVFVFPWGSSGLCLVLVLQQFIDLEADHNQHDPLEITLFSSPVCTILHSKHNWSSARRTWEAQP